MLEDHTILVISAPAEPSSAVAEQLTLHSKMAVDQCALGCAAIELVSRGQYNAVIVDLDEHHSMKNWEYIDHLRQLTPLILLVSKAVRTVDMLKNTGYNQKILQKPLRLSDLLARLSAHIQSHSAVSFARLVGGCSFEPVSKTLSQLGSESSISLTDKEAAIMLVLNRASPEAVSRDDLLKTIWGYSPDIQTHTLETYIYRIRKKIEANGLSLQISTEKDGYRLQSP